MDDSRFQPFDPTRPVRVSMRHLPHWEQEGATYFVTFRTADSLPVFRTKELRQERTLWLRLHPPPWTNREYDDYCRFTFHKLDRWLDNHSGACFLRRREILSIVEEAMRHFDGERYILDDSTLMPNHTHSLLKPIRGWRPRQILHSWKSFTATRINQALGLAGQFWIHESFDRLVRDRRELERIRTYIRANPANAGLEEGEYALFCGQGLR